MNLRQAAQQALEALENAYMVNSWAWVDQKKQVITALRAALAEPEPKPVAWMESPHGVIRANPLYRIKAPQSVAWSIPLYTAPTQRKPLSESELEALWDKAVDHMEHFCSQYWDFARAIERAHGITGETK